MTALLEFLCQTFLASSYMTVFKDLKYFSVLLRGVSPFLFLSSIISNTVLHRFHQNCVAMYIIIIYDSLYFTVLLDS